MTTKQYWPIALDYILNSSDETNVNFLPKINGIPDDFVSPTIKDLEKADLISVQISGGIIVKEAGKDYLEHHKLGLEYISKDTNNVNVHNIHIGDGNTFNQSFNEGDLKNPINVPINIPEKKTTKYPMIKWILAVSATLAASLIFWLLTKN